MAGDGDRLARTLAGLEDPALRVRRASELLASVPSNFAVRIVADLVRGAAQGVAAHEAALEAVLRALHDRKDDPLLADLRLAAHEAEEHTLEGVLSKRAPARVLDKGEPGYVDREMNARTLGHRKSLARSSDRDFLSRLAHDQDPLVIRNLLENPKLTEREVLIAASRRPTLAAVLEELFRSRRWNTNRRVRKALALNPYSPPALASAVISTLTAPDLREVARDPHVRAEVREHAERLISLRAGRVR